MPVRRHHLRPLWGGDNRRFVLVEGRAAASAKVIGCTELNEQATVASDNFPGVDRGESCSHQVLGVARAGIPESQARLQPRSKCGTEPGDVKGNQNSQQYTRWRE